VKLAVGELGKVAAKSSASHYVASPFRCVLAVGLKQLWHGTLGVKSDVHQIETRQIAQLRTAVKVALRRNIAVLHRDIRWTSGLKSHNSLDFAHKWLANKR